MTIIFGLAAIVVCLIAGLFAAGTFMSLLDKLVK